MANDKKRAVKIGRKTADKLAEINYDYRVRRGVSVEQANSIRANDKGIANKEPTDNILQYGSRLGQSGTEIKSSVNEHAKVRSNNFKTNLKANTGFNTSVSDKTQTKKKKIFNG